MRDRRASGRRVAAACALACLVAVAGLLAMRWVRGGPEMPGGDLLSAPAPAAYGVGEFRVSLEGRDPSEVRLSIAHRSDPRRAVWSSLPGEAFVAAADGEETVEESRAHFDIEDRLLEIRPDQTVDRIGERGGRLVVSGRLSDGSEEARYTLSFEAVSDRRLRFVAEVGEPYDRVFLSYASSPEERFFGFGTQYTHLDTKGQKVPIFVEEQGIGRGAQPITLAADLRAGAGGDAFSSYASVPHYLTSQSRSLFLENTEYSSFDLREPDRVRVGVFSGEMRGQVLAADTPSDAIEEYTEYAGRMRPLPDWISAGAVIGMQGGTEEVLETHERLRRLGTPVSAFWLQDWVGQRRTSFGSQLWWNWELDRDRYPRWEAMVERLEGDGVRVMTYASPMLADAAAKKDHRRNLFAEARRKGYLVENEDGGPYKVRITDFSAAFVDLSNPEARAWMEDILQEQVIGSGASGWMADFGEGLPYDAVLDSGADPRAYHNRYPEEWAEVNREAIEEAGDGGDAVFFMRSGFTRSPRHATLFWLGDQLVSWDRHDGIKSAVTGLLSSGFSGYSLNHSDIGGYTAIDNPVLRYHRSKELFMRWAELSAFTVVFRTHEGNRPEDNHQFDTDRETLRHFDRMAEVFAAWEPYRRRLIREASETGMPVVRHPVLHHPNDEEAQALRYQFMVGEDFMVAPVLDEGEGEAEAYLPAGRWVHVWSGEAYGGGGRVTVAAPLGEPAVFYKEGSRAGRRFEAELRRRGLL